MLGPCPTPPETYDYVPLWSQMEQQLQERMRTKAHAFEYTDFENNECQVKTFRKLSLNKNEKGRMNCYVSSFPFSGENITGVDDKL
jgi:hypothetical protein